MNREHDGIADWVINELCDELECDGDEIVERVRRLSAKADTYEKAYNTLGDEHFVLLKRICKMQAEIKEILPDFNCRMFEPYHKLLAALLPPTASPTSPARRTMMAKCTEKEISYRDAVTALADAHEKLTAANAEIERLRAENERLVNRITELNSELTQTELAVEQLQTLIDAI